MGTQELIVLVVDEMKRIVFSFQCTFEKQSCKAYSSCKTLIGTEGADINTENHNFGTMHLLSTSCIFH